MRKKIRKCKWNTVHALANMQTVSSFFVYYFNYSLTCSNVTIGSFFKQINGTVVSLTAIRS